MSENSVYYAKGKISITKLDEFIENNPHVCTENPHTGEVEVSVNVCFYTKETPNGKNMSITFHDPNRPKGEKKFAFGNGFLEFKRLFNLFGL